MANIPGTIPLGGPIAPTSIIDVYATHFAQFQFGGWRAVADNTERDAISSERREEGMVVYVRQPIGIEYELVGGITNAHWQIKASGGGSSYWNSTVGTYGDILSPIAGVKEIILEENLQGLTQFLLKNTNDVDNYAGSLITLKGSGPDFTNNMYIGKYGANFYIPKWAGNGVIATDKDLLISAVGVTSKILIQVGGGYVAPVDVFEIKNSGLLTSLVTNYETLVLADNDIPNKKYIDDSISGISSYTAKTERFIVDNTIITNGYIDLLNTPTSNEHLFVILNGLVMDRGVGNDFTMVSNRITFLISIAETDKIIVKYKF